MNRPFLTIPAIYVLFSLAWIVGSDTLAHSLVRLPADAFWIQIVKGAVFVVVSGLLIGFLVRRYLKELEQRNARLQEALAEREIIIQEVHHRVKNNLQVVLSLLSMQTARSTGDESLALKESENRVRSIARAHELVYRSGSFSGVDVAAYIHDLVETVRDTFLETSRVEFTVRAEHMRIPMSQAVPLGLILSELLTNSAKYAFPEARGRVSVRFAANERLVLDYADSGPGLPPGFDPERSEGMGFEIMRVLVEQLHGEMDLPEGGGFRLRLSFPLARTPVAGLAE